MVIDEASIPNWDDVSEFQFQTGSIKSTVLKVLSHYQSCFNSKLVRLKAPIKAVRAVVHQFCFNSKLVRLKEFS